VDPAREVVVAELVARVDDDHPARQRRGEVDAVGRGVTGARDEHQEDRRREHGHGEPTGHS
jgi:hypothetical protein